MKHLTR